VPQRSQSRERHRVVRAEPEYLVRHRDKRVQIERTRLARSHTCNGTFVATVNSFTQLSGQHARPGHAQRAQLRGRRRQQVKDILVQTVEVELPWDDTRARGGTPKGGELLGHPNDGAGEAVVQPISVRQPHGCGPAFGLSALRRPRRDGACTSSRRGCRHIVGEHIRNAMATGAFWCRDDSLRMSIAL
jgi:hypothetical protein